GVGAVGARLHAEAPPRDQLARDRLREPLLELDPRRPILERRELHDLDVRGQRRALADERVPARPVGEEGGGEEQAAGGGCGGAGQRTTRFRRRSATKTARVISLPSSHGLIRSSPPRTRRASVSDAPRGSSSRPRTLPLTCTTRVTPAVAASAGSKTGH